MPIYEPEQQPLPRERVVYVRKRAPWARQRDRLRVPGWLKALALFGLVWLAFYLT